MSRPGLYPPNPALKGVKRVEDDVDHSHATSAKVNTLQRTGDADLRFYVTTVQDG